MTTTGTWISLDPEEDLDGGMARYLEGAGIFFSEDGKFEDAIQASGSLMTLFFPVQDPTRAAKFVLRLVLVTDLVIDAGLLSSPANCEVFMRFKESVSTNLSSEAFFQDVLDAFENIDGEKGRTWLYKHHWAVHVMRVFRHFHSLTKKMAVSGEKKSQLARTTAMIVERRESAVGLASVTPTDEDDGSGKCVTANQLLTPDFRYCFLLDFGVACGGGGEKSDQNVIGTVQLPVNYRPCEHKALLAFEDFLHNTKDEEMLAFIQRNAYMVPESRHGIYYCSSESSDLGSCDPVSERILYNSMHLRNSMDLEMEKNISNRVGVPVCVMDALKHGILWCGFEGLKKNLEDGSKLILDGSEKEPILKKRGDTNFPEGGDPVDLGGQDPLILFEVLRAGFCGQPETRFLTGRNVHLIARLLFSRYLKMKYGNLVKGSVAESEIQKYVHGEDSGGGGGDIIHNGDSAGLIWLVNLAYSRVRIAMVSGRHRYVSQLQSLLGSKYVDLSCHPPFKKDSSFLTIVDESDFIFHQMNGCHTFVGSIANEEAFDGLVKKCQDISRDLDTSGYHKVQNKFGSILQNTIHGLFETLDHVDGFRRCRLKHRCFFDPRAFSMYFRVILSLDFKLFNVDGFTLEEKNGNIERGDVASTEVVEEVLDLFLSLLNSEKLIDARKAVGGFHMGKKQNALLEFCYKKQISPTPTYSAGRVDKFPDLLKYVPRFMIGYFSDQMLHAFEQDALARARQEAIERFVYRKENKKDTYPYKPEEFVNFCVFAVLLRGLVNDPVFLTFWKKNQEMVHIGCVNQFILCGNPGRIELPTDKKKRPFHKEWKDACMPENIQLLLGIISVMLCHPRGMEILNVYFFGSRYAQLNYLKQTYSKPELVGLPLLSSSQSTDSFLDTEVFSHCTKKDQDDDLVSGGSFVSTGLLTSDLTDNLCSSLHSSRLLSLILMLHYLMKLRARCWTKKSDMIFM